MHSSCTAYTVISITIGPVCSDNHYSSQNNNFPVPSGGQNPNHTPGYNHWAPHQPHTAIPAGSSCGFGFNDYDNIIYTSNTLPSDDPAFYGLADVHGHSNFGSHSSYYASSLNLTWMLLFTLKLCCLLSYNISSPITSPFLFTSCHHLASFTFTPSSLFKGYSFPSLSQ